MADDTTLAAEPDTLLEPTAKTSGVECRVRLAREDRAVARVKSRWRPALPHEGTGHSGADAGKTQDRTSSPSASGATLTAPDERGEAKSPPQPALRPATAEWLPPRALLPPDTPPPAACVWTAWDPSQRTAPRPRGSGRVGASNGSWDAQTSLDGVTAASAADRLYESVGALALFKSYVT